METDLSSWLADQCRRRDPECQRNERGHGAASPASTIVRRFLPLIFCPHDNHADQCRPPFSALFTLWLSMMAAVELALVPHPRGIRRRARHECDPARHRIATRRSSGGPCCTAENPLEGTPLATGAQYIHHPFTTARMSVRRLPPPRFAGGMNGSTWVHSSSVKSLGYLR